MFGTMGFSELIIILVIVLIIFGAGKLPQIGEGLGKALKGFKKEVHEVPQLADAGAPEEGAASALGQPAAMAPADAGQPLSEGAPTPETPATPKPTNVPYQPGPELTPGTTAAMMYAAGPTPHQPPQATPPSAAPAPQPSPAPAARPAPAPNAPPTMEERMANPAPVAQASYPPLPAGAQPKPGAKRPSAIVNKDAVARVQAKQAALRQAGAQKGGGVSPKDMQNLGEGLGDALRTFRQAASDVRGAIEPEIRTLQSEFDSAQKEMEQTVESAKQMPSVHEDPPPST